MTGADFTIGRMARETRTKAQTIRYYEQIGILPVPMRSAGNQRLYGPADVERLAFVRHGRALGFSLGAIRELLSLADTPDRPCEAVDRIARAHVQDVESRIASLMALKAELDRMIDQCSGGNITECRIIGVLADHSLCLSEEHAASKRT